MCLYASGDILPRMKSNATPRMLWPVFLGLAAALLWGCEQQSTVPLQANLSPQVARVGNTVIHEDDIDYEILSMPESMRGVTQDNNARAKILDIIIKREAVAQKGMEIGLHLDPLITYRIHQAQNAVLIQSIHDWQSNGLSRPSPEEVAAYFNTHRDEFIVPEQVHVRHILVSNKQEALDIITQLQGGHDSFASLAAQYSIDDSNKGRAGDLNWFPRGTMVKAFEDVAFSLNVKNKLSQPIKTEFGWHVVEWLGFRERSVPSLEETKDEIIAILHQQKMDAAMQALIDDVDGEVLKPEYQLR